MVECPPGHFLRACISRGCVEKLRSAALRQSPEISIGKVRISSFQTESKIEMGKCAAESPTSAQSQPQSVSDSALVISAPCYAASPCDCLYRPMLCSSS